jgi:hypothetical protein
MTPDHRAAARAPAMFASGLSIQYPPVPAVGTVAIKTTNRAPGARECASQVAAPHEDHPQTAPWTRSARHLAEAISAPHATWPYTGG